MLKAAIVAVAIGGMLAVVEGLLLIVLANLAGLAERPEAGAAMTESAARMPDAGPTAR